MRAKTLTLFFLLGQLVSSSPADLQKRTGCNADNCLRELRGTSALASPYCSTYLGVVATVTTVTVTTTIPIYGTAPLSQIEKRSTAAGFYPSKCTEAATAVSSGCSCLIGLTTPPPGPTATVTVTATSALPTQCDAAHHYGLITNGFGIIDGPGQANHYYSFYETQPGSCCARCYDTVNCVAFAEFDYPDNIECLIWEVYVSPTSTTNPLCPLGTLAISLSQPNPTGDAGIGPCGKPST